MITLRGLTLTLFISFAFVHGNENDSDTTINSDDLIRRAEEDIDNETKEMMKMGARSKRFVHKKITPM